MQVLLLTPEFNSPVGNTDLTTVTLIRECSKGFDRHALRRAEASAVKINSV